MIANEPWHKRHPAVFFLLAVAGLVGLMALGGWESSTSIQGSPDVNFGVGLAIVALLGFVALWWWLAARFGWFLLWVPFIAAAVFGLIVR